MIDSMLTALVNGTLISTGATLCMALFLHLRSSNSTTRYALCWVLLAATVFVPFLCFPYSRQVLTSARPIAAPVPD